MPEELNESTCQLLDSLAAYGVYGWEKHNDTYSFDTMWGNGLPAPEGENEEEDMIFSLSVEKGSRTITVSFGAW